MYSNLTCDDDSTSTSMEYLLKRVYVVHRNKTRQLENKINELSRTASADKSNMKCTLCEQHNAVCHTLKEKYASQLEEKDKVIESLIAEIAMLKKAKRQNDLVKLEIPTKRKKKHFSERNLGFDEEGQNDSDDALVKLKSTEQLDVKVDANDPQSLDMSDLTPSSIVLVPDTLDIDVIPVNTPHEQNMRDICEPIVVLETLPTDVIVDVPVSDNVTVVPKVDVRRKLTELHNSCKIKHQPSNPNWDFEPCEMDQSLDDFEECTKSERTTGHRSVRCSPHKKKSRAICESSSFKPKHIYFEHAPKRYRKPRYKQTTLTQNSFVGNVMVNEEIAKVIEASLFTYKSENKNGKSQSPGRTSLCDVTVVGECSTKDNPSLDETYVPSQLIRKRSATVNDNSSTCDDLSDQIDKENHVSSRYNHSTDSDSTCSEDLLKELGVKSPEKIILNKPIPTSSTNIVSRTESVDDFDRVPSRKPRENYKFKGDVVRNQQERRKLDGHECKDCEEYFKVVGLTEEEKKRRMEACSRHRDKHVAPITPEHFWSLDFPPTQECKTRGVWDSTQHRPLQSRRRRQQLN